MRSARRATIEDAIENASLTIIPLRPSALDLVASEDAVSAFLEVGDDVDGGGLAQESGELGFGEADGRGVVGIVRDAEWTQVFWFNWNDCSGM